MEKEEKEGNKKLKNKKEGRLNMLRKRKSKIKKALIEWMQKNEWKQLEMIIGRKKF